MMMLVVICKLRKWCTKSFLKNIRQKTLLLVVTSNKTCGNIEYNVCAGSYKHLISVSTVCEYTCRKLQYDFSTTSLCKKLHCGMLLELWFLLTFSIEYYSSWETMIPACSICYKTTCVQFGKHFHKVVQPVVSSHSRVVLKV